ncbi:hypothetical protein QBC42DRAFT_168987 [Cladorrhinum samala]|uniref:Uncharacterized protein n=1 Tax=Cladorrhinum samala TaxID=585594 RepID=A0AAV9I0A8_9PEZI|nr:hypothetical protein QBC42DRAFT_168987 [Cladorrhinum samala]
MPTQRPFFLSTFFAAFRQQPPSAISSSPQQHNKHTAQVSSPPSAGNSNAAPLSISSSAHTAAAAAAAASQATSPSSGTSRTTGLLGQLPLHSPRHHQGIPIPQQGNNHGRRRGSDSSSEGFRDALGAEKLYIGGRTATGEERFFKLGVVRRVKSGDRLSLDRLSL